MSDLEKQASSSTLQSEQPMPSKEACCSQQRIITTLKAMGMCIWNALVVIAIAIKKSAKEFLRKIVVCFRCDDDEDYEPEWLRNLETDEREIKEREMKDKTKRFYDKSLKPELEKLTGSIEVDEGSDAAARPVHKLSYNEQFNMAKGETKRIDMSIRKKVNVGLGWTLKDQGVDLDASCVLLSDMNGDGELGISTICYFGNKVCRGVELTGDNLTGVGDGDDEVVKVDLSNVDSTISCLAFTVNVFTKNQSYESVKSAYVRLYDPQDNHQFCYFKIDVEGHDPATRGMNGLIFCTISRSLRDNEWDITMIGQHATGNVAREIVIALPDKIKCSSLRQTLVKKWEMFHTGIQKIQREDAAKYQRFFSLDSNHHELNDAVADIVQALPSDEKAVLLGAQNLHFKSCDKQLLQNGTIPDHVKIFMGVVMKFLVPFDKPRENLLKAINGTEQGKDKGAFVIDMTKSGLKASIHADNTFLYLALSNVRLLILMMSTVLPCILLSIYNITLNLGTKSFASCSSTSLAFAQAMNSTKSSIIGIPSDADFNVPCPSVYLPFSFTVPKSTFSPFVTAGPQCIGFYPKYSSLGANKWQYASQFVCYTFLVILCYYLVIKEAWEKKMTHFCVKFKSVFLQDEDQRKEFFMNEDEEYKKGLGELYPTPKNDEHGKPLKPAYSGLPTHYNHRGLFWVLDWFWHNWTSQDLRYYVDHFMRNWLLIVGLVAVSCFYVAALTKDPTLYSVFYIFPSSLLPMGKYNTFYDNIIASKPSGIRNSGAIVANTQYQVSTCSPALNAFPPIKLVYSTAESNDVSPITAIVQGLLFFYSAYVLVQAQAVWYDWIDRDEIMEARGKDTKVVPYWDYPAFRDKSMSPFMIHDSMWASKHLRFAYWLYQTYGPNKKPSPASQEGASKEVAIDISGVKPEAWERLKKELFDRTEFQFEEAKTLEMKPFNSQVDVSSTEFKFKGLLGFIEVTNRQFATQRYAPHSDQFRDSHINPMFGKS